MELHCDTCGIIGMWVAKDEVAQWTVFHVEGRPPGTRSRYDRGATPHPGHVVTSHPDNDVVDFHVKVKEGR